MPDDSREDRIAKVGKWFGTFTWVWLCTSAVLLILIVVAALLGR